MNKRIFDIARQVGATDEQGGRAKTVFCFTKHELEEFAKSMVLECADVSAKHWLQYKGCSAHFSIREHFGVEE